MSGIEPFQTQVGYFAQRTLNTISEYGLRVGGKLVFKFNGKLEKKSLTRMLERKLVLQSQHLILHPFRFDKEMPSCYNLLLTGHFRGSKLDTRNNLPCRMDL